MFENCNLSSISSLKRQASETDTDFLPKKTKLNVNEHDNKELLLEPLEQKCEERNAIQAKTLVSLILKGHNRNVQIYPSQIVWCRLEKSAFWPAMIWPSKSGKITDDQKRTVRVSFFGRRNANVWVKLDNIFPFDGFESFEKMKNSVDIHFMTTKMKRDFDFAFNITSELWPRAVAEAIFCTRKDREERLALFLTFSSLSKSRKIWKDQLQRRSIEQNTTNRCLVKASRVNYEIGLVQSSINKISFPSTDIATNEKEIPYSEKQLLRFVTESRASSRFGDGMDKVCNVCSTNQSTDHELIKCAGNCDGYLHRKCYANWAPQNLNQRDDAGGPDDLICENCTDESKALCFICKANEDSPNSQMVTCKVTTCLRQYHTKCLENWPQAKYTGSDQDLICPLHECHQCGSNPTEKDFGAKLTTCIKCPTAVHNDACCIHAGMVILSDSHQICLNHRQLQKTASHLDYCYVCNMGCNLLRCRSCPRSYHQSCSTSGSTTCVKCLSGQHPVYGDIVWAKLYSYAWWPAIIVPPHCVPQNIRTYKHLPHDMCVCFFGDHTFAWINRQLVYSFEEDNFALFTENGSKFSDAILSARKWALHAKCIKSEDRQTPPSTSTSADSSMIPTPFENIVANVFIDPATRIIDSDNEASPCQCKVDANNDDPCGVSTDCLNRALYTECNELCPNAAKCRNKCVQQGKYAEVKLKYFGPKGFGLIAGEQIPSGVIVQQYTGEVITTWEFERRARDEMRSNVYFMKYTKDYYIDGETKGSLARYINHSCNPNCEFRLWSVYGENVVVVIALEDIPKDTEITCKYNWSRHVPCLCNEENCSGIC